MKPQQQQSNISGFLSRYTYVLIAFSLISGIAIGFFTENFRQSSSDFNKSQMHAVQLLIHDGKTTKTWNNISLNEGDSVAKIIDRVAAVDNIQVVWNGEGKDRILTTLLNSNSNDGTWNYYINNSMPQVTVGRYFPKSGDVVTLVYLPKNP